MKIKITTIREFPSEFFLHWLRTQQVYLPWLTSDVLEKGKQTYSNQDYMGPDAVTRATTTVEIIER